MATSMSEPTDVLQHVAIEIPKGSYDSLVICLKEKMETMTTASCIFKVDEKLREIDEKHYLPQTVSIGLFHHGRDNTKFMEEHKWRYLYSLLNRKSHLEATLDKCVKSLRELEHKARLCYKDLKQDEVPSDKFVEIMLADAGFLIELFLKYAIKGLKRRGDYVFNTSGLLYELRCDMLLLENQIPYFILQQLFEIVPIPNHCKLSLTELAFRFFRDMIPGDHRLHLAKFGQEGNHFLDLIRHCFLPTVPRIKAKQQEEVRGLPYKASKLKDAGIKLKKATTEDLLDIKFVKGVLEIPPINVHQYTETLLRNLIAIEQSGPGTTNHISSYVFLMKTLLPENKDVKLVKRKQILTNYDVNDKKQVETLFHRLCEEMKVMENADDEFYYNGLCEQVKEYKKSSWQPRLKTMQPPLKPGYLQRPLPRIVIVLLVLFIVLVFVGALFSIISFFRHKL